MHMLKKIYSLFLNREGAHRFKGSIGRLVVISSPSGSGETTFLDAPHLRMAKSDLPVELFDLFDLAKTRTDAWALWRRKEVRIDSLAMGFDISSPLRGFNSQAFSRDDVFSLMKKELWEGRDRDLLSRADQIIVLHMHVNRRENQDRIMSRMLARGESEFDSAALLCSVMDTTDNSRIHRALNHAWISYCQSFSNSKIYILDANRESYSFVSLESYVHELEHGYAT